MPFLEEPAYQIISVAFGEDFVEVNYRIEEHQHPDVYKVESLIIRELRFREHVASIIDLLCDLVTEADVARRNPEATFTRPEET